MNQITQLIKKHREIILYLIFGVLTTLVNWCVYYPLFNVLHLPATISNLLAWAAAVVFAFLTNKPFVFESKDWSWKTTFPEFIKFMGCRIGSGVLESVFILITVDLLTFNGNLMKIIISAVVVVVNYIGSKLLFRKK